MNYDEFVKLILKKQDGQATAEEIAYIDRMMEEDDEAKQIWQDVQETFATQESRAYFLARNEHALKENIVKHVLVTNRKRAGLTVAASLLVTLIFIISYLWFNKRNTKEGPDPVSLEFANGQKINIDDHRNINVKSSWFYLDGGTLIVNKENTVNSHGWSTLVVPKTRMYNIRLLDSSMVRLNSSSRLKFPLNFSSAVREVYLDGEAYFEVTANANQPFLVHTPKGDISVLGTSFNVNTYGEGFVVSLVKGSVVVSGRLGKPGTLLREGFVAVADTITGRMNVLPFDEEALDWMNERYHFDSASIIDIAGVVDRWYNVRFIYDDNKISKEYFTGIIDKRLPLKSLLDNLKATALVDFYIASDSAVHLFYPLKRQKN